MPYNLLIVYKSVFQVEMVHRVPDYDLFIYQYLCMKMDINSLYII